MPGTFLLILLRVFYPSFAIYRAIRQGTRVFNDLFRYPLDIITSGQFGFGVLGNDATNDSVLIKLFLFEPLYKNDYFSLIHAKL